MIGLDMLVNMIATEVIEEEYKNNFFDKSSHTNLPPIRYDLELIRKPDGSYEWME